MSPALTHTHYVLQNGGDSKSFSAKQSNTPKRKHELGNAQILDRRPGQVFVHYIGTDKRLDEWVPADTVRATTPPRDSLSPVCDAAPSRRVNGTSARKRRRSLSLANAHDQDALDTTQPSAALPTMASTRRNFDKVNFGPWQIKTW